MCTVSWLRQPEGYVLLCNRDERHQRKPAGGPRPGRVRGVSFVAPIDGDHGGSWIGANEFGLTLCLLNRYGDWAPDLARVYNSRGLLLTDLLDCRRSEVVTERLGGIDLEAFQPFTLLALTAAEPALLFDWTGFESTIQPDAEAQMPLTSSSISSRVVDLRRQLFAKMASQGETLDVDMLRQFHCSHIPERGPGSICMHREDAATVSLSIVTVSLAGVEFVYQPGAPCHKARTEAVVIDRKLPEDLQEPLINRKRQLFGMR